MAIRSFLILAPFQARFSRRSAELSFVQAAGPAESVNALDGRIMPSGGLINLPDFPRISTYRGGLQRWHSLGSK